MDIVGLLWVEDTVGYDGCDKSIQCVLAEWTGECAYDVVETQL